MPGIVDNFRGIPMADLIGGPLTATCAAQMNLARAMVEFIKDVGVKGDKAQTLDFVLQRAVDNGSGKLTNENLTINAPLLGLVPIPALLVDLVTVDFSMEVTDSRSSTTSTQGEVDFQAKVGWGFFSASVSGKLSTSKENTRKTDYSAKYNVHVQARQQPPAEGMSKLMDVLSTAATPIKIESGGGGGGG
ncbi:MAG TPA: DUF2589 domain-containing protein [candidate division Zixibacteria bacterium]|nr:DUF2589 domain-containing protein [candidate division Zixibacteria bacterium]